MVHLLTPIQLALAKWLSKPLLVAYKSKQSEDHPSENEFTKANG
jgi:hypothetical protein